MKPIERLFQYLEYKGIKPTRAERDFGLSNGYLALTLKRKGDIGSQIVDKILNNCPDLSQEWLMLGTGQMLKIHRSIVDQVIPEEHYNEIQSSNRPDDFKQKEIEMWKELYRLQGELMDEIKKERDRLQKMLDENK